MLRVLLASIFISSSPALAQITASTVEASVRTVADWQLAHPNENQLREVGIRQWHIAPLYNGLLSLAKMTGEARYLSEIVRQGELANWTPGSRVYHADDIAVGHAWLDLYAMDRNHTERFDFWKERLDYIIAHPPTIGLTHLGRKQTEQRLETHHDRWSWSDALFMAPPTYARMYALTGDEKYLTFLESEWRLTHSVLYDPESALYYRDTRFVTERIDNGKKILWARGNAWVYGGIALTLEKLPQEHSLRPFLEQIFLEMSTSLASRQQADGLWYPNLDDPHHIPTKESSGTAFFTYGMAWGINHGLLSREAYWPVIEKAWQGLESCIQDSGMLGYVQPIGASPENNIKANLTQLYGSGAFLMAGTEIMKLLGRTHITHMAEMLDRAEAMAFRDGEPEAIATFQPFRKDDVAWENDKMAFRVYGPALRNSAENSGIDCWMKSVPTPVVRQWYADEFSGKKSYHTDLGEGYDGYKVGAARGCGGTALWTDGTLETSNVYKSAQILWTRPDEAKIRLSYYYRDDQIREAKIISLKLGDDFCTVTSRFTAGAWGPVISAMEIAVGLTAQSDKAQFQSSREEGWMAVWDQYPNGDEIGTAVILAPDDLERFELLGEGAGSESIAILKTDERGFIHYRMGFTWIRGKLPKSLEDWSSVLSRAAP